MIVSCFQDLAQPIVVLANPVAGFVLMLNQDARKTKDPQLSELAGLMNVKDFSLTIVLAEAVGFEPTIQV